MTKKLIEKKIKIIDFKCPTSKMHKKNDWNIIKDITKHDEIKFVIGNKNDFEWAKSKIYKYRLQDKCTILFSPVFNKIKPNIITFFYILLVLIATFLLASGKENLIYFC